MHTLVMGVAILLLSFWVVRRLTKPLSEVAAAAERLGRDVGAPPLSESGPLEVRMVARAFNNMQERLCRFVEDRTRMLAAISHDLRTPITLLRLRTEFIAETEEKVRMRATLDEMEAMIAATLPFARDEADTEPRQTVYLVGLLSSICYDMADAGLPVSFEPDSDDRLPIEFPIEEGSPTSRCGIIQKDTDLAILDLACGATVLSLHAGRLSALLDEAGLVNHQSAPLKPKLSFT